MKMAQWSRLLSGPKWSQQAKFHNGQNVQNFKMGQIVKIVVKLANRCVKNLKMPKVIISIKILLRFQNVPIVKIPQHGSNFEMNQNDKNESNSI